MAVFASFGIVISLLLYGVLGLVVLVGRPYYMLYRVKAPALKRLWALQVKSENPGGSIPSFRTPMLENLDHFNTEEAPILDLSEEQ